MDQAEDVEVVLGHQRYYKFHSGTLARNSTLFADLLTESKAVKLSKAARHSGIKIRWTIELTRLPDEADEEYPAGRLELVQLTPTGERADQRSRLIVNENGRVPKAEKAFDHYETVLYAFYNKELAISDTNMSAGLEDCYKLLQISDYLGCTNVISKPIEVALLKHGQDLFRAIQQSPFRWIEIATRVRSQLVFRECMIHLVGNWKKFKSDRKVGEYLREVPGLRALIEKYSFILLKKCRALELSIVSLYPGKMKTPSEDLPIKREVYAKDILVWMALTFYRHWIGQRLIMEKGRGSVDCGYELYHQIGLGGEAYMDKSVINQFHTNFPMTKKAVNVLENHLLEIKECMKGLVDQHKILKSNCELDINRFPVKYLTCTDFQREDYPWLKEVTEPSVVPAKREYKPGGNDIAKRNLDHTRAIRDRSLSPEDVDEEEDELDEEDDEPVSAGKRRRSGNNV